MNLHEHVQIQRTFWKRILLGSALGFVIPPAIGVFLMIRAFAQVTVELEATGQADPVELATELEAPILVLGLGLIITCAAFTLLIIALFKLRALSESPPPQT